MKYAPAHFTLFDLLSVSREEEEGEQTVVDNFLLCNKRLTNGHSHIQQVYMTVILPGDIVLCQTDGQSGRTSERGSHRAFRQLTEKC